MFDPRSISMITLSAALCLSADCVQAFDDATYPDLKGQWIRIAPPGQPAFSRVAFLWNPDNASNVLQFEQIQAAAPTLGVAVISLSVSPLVEPQLADPSLP